MDMRELLKGLQHGTAQGDGDGRRLMFVEGFKLRYADGTSDWPEERLAEFRSLGEQLLPDPIAAIPFSLYKLFDTTGERERFQEAYFARRKRLDVFAVLSLAERDARYIAALEDVIWAICDEYAWSLPAHMGGRSLQPGEDHKAVIDLFAAETAFYLSEIIHLLEAELSGLVAERARKEIRTRVLEPYASLSPAAWWETSDMNWAAVCAGSVGMAAMYTIPDDAALNPILHRVLASMACFVDGFADDGACLEGVLYWNYGFGFYAAFAELLRQRTGGAVDLMRQDKIRRMALFQQKCYLGANTVISYSDSKDTSDYQPGLTHYLKRVYEEVEVPGRLFEAGILGDDCFRWIHVIRNLVWYDPEAAHGGLGDADYYLDQAQIVVSRCTTDAGQVAFSAKGGFNDEPHNHNDAGSFIYSAGGKQLLADPGAGVYSKEYFGDQRYSMIYNGSHGHSVPIVDGSYQRAGAEYKANVLHVDMTGNEIECVMDIAAAYDFPKLSSLVRHFRFDKRSGGLLLQDRFAFREQPGSYQERFVTFHEPAVVKDGVIRISGQSGVSALLRFDASRVRPTLSSEPFIPGRRGKERLFCIDLTAIHPTMTDTIEVAVSIEKKGDFGL